MTEFIVCCPHNKPGINPNTGLMFRDGAEFLAEANNYRAFHGIQASVYRVDNRRAPIDRFAELLGYLEKLPSPTDRYDSFVFFGHGLKSGLQAGCTRQNVGQLASALRRVCAARLVATLYACSAGADADVDELDESAPGPGGEGGYADLLRDALEDCGVSATVFAHTTAGHCTRNPHVRAFRPGLESGEWLVEPRTPFWPAWTRYLSHGHGRFAWPKMTKEQITAVVGG